MLFVYLLLFLAFSFLLVRATDIMIDGLQTLLAVTRLPSYGLAAFLVAFATSLPELLVGISAGLHNQSALSLGNVLGSNIANLSLVLGGAAMLSGALRATDEFLKTEVFYVFLVGALPLLLLVDGTLSRSEGWLLIVVYVIYTMITLRQKGGGHERVVVEHRWRRLLVRLSQPRMERSMGMLLMGIAGLILSAEMMVRLAGVMATMLGIPVLLIGLFIVAVGTSLPELAFEIGAVRRREVAMAFGNVLGSVVANSTLILGVTVVLSPLVLGADLQQYLLATVAFVVVFFLFWYFVWTKHRLDRWEAAVLFASYLVFAWLELIRTSH